MTAKESPNPLFLRYAAAVSVRSLLGAVPRFTNPGGGLV